MDLYRAISKLKQEKRAVILAHNYQRPEVQEAADFVGDSLELAVEASRTDAKIIVFAGVRFMAETAKILSPDKKVLLPRKEAGCPMANMASREQVLKLKKQYPDAAIVSYVNTTADVKAISDICCTSANAVKVVKSLPNKRIIFVPDQNLAAWVASQVPEKEIIAFPGFCYVHMAFSASDVEEAKEKHPQAEILVHPECKPEVTKRADYVLSTSGMVRHAATSESKEFVIGTEYGLTYRLKKENPDKQFYPLGRIRVCWNMKLTKLEDVYDSLKYERYEINLDRDTIEAAARALRRMIELK